MKILSVRPPWPWFMFNSHPKYGLKTVENRTWPTNYRGPLGIHVGQRLDTAPMYWLEPGDEALTQRGLIIGRVDLVDCHPSGRHDTEDGCWPWGQEDEGVWHWVLRNPRRFAEPVWAKGQLGLWTHPIYEEE